MNGTAGLKNNPIDGNITPLGRKRPIISGTSIYGHTRISADGLTKKAGALGTIDSHPLALFYISTIRDLGDLKNPRPHGVLQDPIPRKILLNFYCSRGLVLPPPVIRLGRSHDMARTHHKTQGHK
jgi:hypothetical protein